ncbi:MAG: hypoxanthine phosphoribosyltransferase [Ruminococcaceae bacterium]|nr:hypoxanthine phosphoribosyltransferase [Oscillospiraceae bacterium]
MKDDILKVLLSEEEIKAKVKELGAQITKDYQGKTPVVISVLKGSFVFVSDLVRCIDVPTEMDFMAVSSFNGVVSTGAVRIIKDIAISLDGRDVLVVEDILDSGLTLAYISDILKGRKANSVKIATLLDKPSRRKSSIVADYVGFVVPDEFVVGYGLDYNELYRNLPYIGILKPEVYSDVDKEIMEQNK